MYDVREIKKDKEFEDVKNLWGSSTRLMRDTIKIPFNDLRTGGVLVGAYDKDDLIGVMRYCEWSSMPYYSIGRLYIKPNTIPRYDFSNPKNPIIYITDFILSTMEQKQRYEWYYVRALSKAYAKIQEDGNDLLNKSIVGNRYHRYVEKIFNPGEIPDFNMHRLLMGDREWNRHIMLVKCSLDNQYRIHGDIFKTEKIFLNNVKENTTTYRNR